MRHSLSISKPKTRSTAGLRACHHCHRVYVASAKWCPNCYDADGHARTPQPAAPRITVQSGQQIAVTQPISLSGGGVIPVGAVASVLNPTTTWQGNIRVSIGEIELALAPTYFIPQPSTVTA